jgi:hypothetical protein
MSDRCSQRFEADFGSWCRGLKNITQLILKGSDCGPGLVGVRGDGV